MSDKLNILKKMHSVMAEVERIGKDRTNKHGGYQYASEKVIKEAFHAAFVKHGVIMKIDASNPRTISTLNGKNNGQEESVCMAVDIEYRFSDTETGEFIEGNFIGSGNGRDDKGIYAAITGGIKYLLTSNYLIPTGDDPEDNKFDKETPPPTAKKPPAPVQKPAPAPAPTPAPAPAPTPVAKPVPAAANVNIPAPDAGDDVLLTREQINSLEAIFTNLGIDVFEIAAHLDKGKDPEWNIADRKYLLRVYSELTTSGSEYSRDKFLAGVRCE